MKLNARVNKNELNNLIRNINLTGGSRLRSAENETIKECLEDLNKAALKNLKSKLGSNKWGINWSKPESEDSIFNRDNIEIKIEGFYGNAKGTLTYTSPHAMVVEFGGLTKGKKFESLLNNPPYKVWPIGKQQGYSKEDQIPRPYFTVQAGYKFLSLAKGQKENSLDFRKIMWDIFNKTLKLG